MCQLNHLAMIIAELDIWMKVGITCIIIEKLIKTPKLGEENQFGGFLYIYYLR